MRTKTVCPTDEIAHLWAHSAQPFARNGHGGNFSFKGDRLFSYWSNIGRILKKDVCAVLNSRRYSATTDRHQRQARDAVSHFMHVFEISVAHSRDALCRVAGADIADHYRAEAVSLLETAQRARGYGNRPTLNQKAEESVRKANEAAEYFRLRRKPLGIAALARDVSKLSLRRKAERQDALAAAREFERRKTDRAIDAATQFLSGAGGWHPDRGEMARLPRALADQIRARDAEDENARLVAWLRGEGSAYQSLHCDGPTLLRAADGQMETSKGARVPLADAQRAYLFAQRVRAKGWHRNGEQFAIGHYQLDAVNEHGVVAGCHRVSWAECERFACAMGWTTTEEQKPQNAHECMPGEGFDY